MNKKGNVGLVILAIIVIGGLVWAYNSGNLNISPVNSVVDIEDLNKNPEEYYGEEITIKGMLDRRIGGYSLENSNGYWVWIGENVLGKGCIEDQREYEYNSKRYTATGTLIPDDCEEFCFGWSYGEPHFKCSIPLN